MTQQQTPVRGVAAAAANAALAAGASNAAAAATASSTNNNNNLASDGGAVLRSTSIESDSHSAGTGGGGIIGSGSGSITGNENASLAGSITSSFRASPLTTPRQQQQQQQAVIPPVGSVPPPFPVIPSSGSGSGAGGNTTTTQTNQQQHQQVVAPPPWPTTTTSSQSTPTNTAAATPQRQITQQQSQQQQQTPTANVTTHTPARSTSPIPPTPNTTTPIHTNTNTITMSTTPNTNNMAVAASPCTKMSSASVAIEPPDFDSIPNPPSLTTNPTLSFPPGGQQQQAIATTSLSLSMTKSGESLFSASATGGSGSGGGNTTNGNTAAGGTAVNLGGSGSTAADSSVLLGLEELERQQAHVEQRRAEAAAVEQTRLRAHQQQQVQQQQSQQGGGQGGGMGLPPLGGRTAGYPPRPTSAPPSGSYNLHGSTLSNPANTNPDAVPSHIHLVNDDEDTILSSDALENNSKTTPRSSDAGGAAAGGGGGGGRAASPNAGGQRESLKRIASIEKFKGSVTVGLRRFRSWSQDALTRSSLDNPAGASVDSTQNATLTSGEEGQQSQSHKMDTGLQQQQQRRPSSAQKKLGNSNSIISEPYLDDDELKPLIYGYLHKLGRNGHWQKRFFETNGERLTYYKSVKRTKVLATLDLCKVGEIFIDKTDPDECTFTIQVKNRPYYLRAEDKARCNDWVINLNRHREARMHEGNIHLVTPKLKDGSDGGLALLDAHRSQAGSDDYAPCIVISALRQRTQAVNFGEGGVDGVQPLDLLSSNTAEDEQQIEVTQWDEQPHSTQQEGVVGVVGGRGALSPTGGGVEDSQSMAKWQKRHSKMHTLSVRFLKWARSITNQADACRKESDVVVVPAHVVLAAQQQQQAITVGEGMASSPSGTTAASDPVGGGQQGAKYKHNPSLPGVMEETPGTPTTPPGPDSRDNSEHNRSRANTESPAFGSTYV